MLWIALPRIVLRPAAHVRRRLERELWLRHTLGWLLLALLARLCL